MHAQLHADVVASQVSAVMLMGNLWVYLEHVDVHSISKIQTNLENVACSVNVVTGKVLESAS